MRRRPDHRADASRRSPALRSSRLAAAPSPRAARPLGLPRHRPAPRTTSPSTSASGSGTQPDGQPDSRSPASGSTWRSRAGITHDARARLPHRLPPRRRGQVTQADRYGRPFDTETYGTNDDTSPTRSCACAGRWRAASAAELGLELRAYLPIEAGSRFGLMFGAADRAARRRRAHRHRALRPDDLHRPDARRW